MLLLLVQEQVTTFGSLLETFGPVGVALGAMWFMLQKHSRRVDDLEKQQQDEHKLHLESHKEMIEDYVELIKSNQNVIGNLTNCIKAIKDTLDRIETKKDD